MKTAVFIRFSLVNSQDYPIHPQELPVKVQISGCKTHKNHVKGLSNTLL